MSAKPQCRTKMIHQDVDSPTAPTFPGSDSRFSCLTAQNWLLKYYWHRNHSVTRSRDLTCAQSLATHGTDSGSLTTLMGNMRSCLLLKYRPYHLEVSSYGSGLLFSRIRAGIKHNAEEMRSVDTAIPHCLARVSNIINYKCWTKQWQWTEKPRERGRRWLANC